MTPNDVRKTTRRARSVDLAARTDRNLGDSKPNRSHKHRVQAIST